MNLILLQFQMFDNIAKLRFQDGNANEKVASAMISSEGEVMDFRQPILAEGRVEGDVGELQLANEHGEGLDQAEAKVVKEGIISVDATIVFMEEDVEAKSEGKEEKRIPDEEGGKGFEDPIEHGGVDVVGRKPRMPTHHRHQLDPEKEELKKELFQNKVCFFTTR